MSSKVPAKWDATKIPSQKGRRAIVTGANSGIGYVTALELARHGADVVLACRSDEKGAQAIKSIREELQLSPEAGNVEFRKLDLGSLASVQAFADGFKADHDRLDLLINNAGIMAGPYRVSADGLESQFATNHLGHFALTAHLFDHLKRSANARVVNVSSKIHKDAQVDLQELVTPEDKYDGFTVYANTKVYNILFTYEINRRLQAQGTTNVIATAAHPGFTTTNLIQNLNWFQRQLVRVVRVFPIAQSSEFGALPTLYAAVGENVQPSDYFGPDGWGAYTGYPTKEQPVNVSESEEHARVLWRESERLAGLRFPFRSEDGVSLTRVGILIKGSNFR